VHPRMATAARAIMTGSQNGLFFEKIARTRSAQ
jgi:hypothetical protein